MSPQSIPYPNNSFKLKSLNQFQWLRATPLRVLIPGLCLAQEHHGPGDLGKCLCTETELDHVHNRGGFSDLWGWIYFPLSAIACSTESMQTKAQSHFTPSPYPLFSRVVLPLETESKCRSDKSPFEGCTGRTLAPSPPSYQESGHTTPTLNSCSVTMGQTLTQQGVWGFYFIH